MSKQTGQNFGNHIRIDNKAIIVLLIGFTTFVLGVAGMITQNTVIVAAGVTTAALGIVGGIVTARAYGTGLQDRIIRTEMKIRMRDVLDADLAAKADALTMPQLVGLRFASDGELAVLLQKVLDEDIAKAGEIKKLITDWQGDYHRV